MSTELMLVPHEDGTVSIYLGAGETHITWPDALDIAKHLVTTAAITAHWVGASREVWDITLEQVAAEAIELLDQLDEQPS